ncbi:MAG: hypothetical protein ACR2GH_05955 [Pseudonocardia sp.]
MTAIPPPSPALTETIARYRGLVERLLAEHVDDGTGYCTTCLIAGSAGERRWPCRLHGLAVLARGSLDAAAHEHRLDHTLPR